MADQTGAGNPASSPDANQPTEGNPDANNLGDPSVLEPSAEQAEWNQLSGKAQDRFSDMHKRTRRAEAEAAEAAARLRQAEEDLKRVSQTQPQTYSNPRDDEVKRAVDTLKQERFTQFEDVEKLVDERVNQATKTLTLQNEHDKLKRQYGRMQKKDPRYPTYDPEQVEDYGRRNNIFNLRAAYEDMYRDEIRDIERGGTKKRQPISEKPGASNSGSREEPMDLDKLREKLKGPKGKEYYAQQMSKNPESFQALISQLTQG